MIPVAFVSFVSFVAGGAATITVLTASTDRTWWPWAIATSVLLCFVAYIIGADGMARLDQLQAGWQHEQIELRSLYEHEQQAMALANGCTSERAMYATGIAPLKYLGEK